MQIKIQNFRGFSNKTPIKLAKTNILIGENSSGKSSLIKLLLLLKQSHHHYGNKCGLEVDGPLIDLGRYKDIVSQYDVTKKISVTFSFKDIDFLELYYNILSGVYPEKSLEDLQNETAYITSELVHLTFTFEKNKHDFDGSHLKLVHNKIGRLTINIDEIEKDVIIKDIKGSISLKAKNKKEIKIDTAFSRYSLFAFSSVEPILKYCGDNAKLFNEIAYLLIGQNYIQDFFDSIKYINPINYKPKRIYLKRDTSSNINDISDFEAITKLLSKHDNADRIIKKLNQAMKELGIAKKIKIIKDSKSPTVEMKVKIGKLWNNITDVGFGVGLQVPILLQAIISSESNRKQTLIIEQPEIHLHPALHSKFIEVLIKYASGCVLIIETHSEHIVRKLQVLVKNNNLKNNNVEISYFKNANNKFMVTSHKIIENGRLEPVFPEGFYDNSYNLVQELF